MEPNKRQNGGKMEPKIEVSKKVPKVSSTHYLLYIITIGTLQKPNFLAPGSSKNAGLRNVVPPIPPRGCNMPPTGPKNAESGVPRDPQGSQRVSQYLPKCSQKSSKISTPLQECLQGPPRPQNTSILYVPPTGVTPSRGNVQPSPLTLCYTPLTSSTQCEASPERGGLGVSPLGYRSGLV